MYFYGLFLQKCNFSQAQCKLPEDGPNGPKQEGANIRYFNVNFNILCLIKCAFVGKKEFCCYQDAWYNDTNQNYIYDPVHLVFSHLVYENKKLKYVA